MTPPTIRVVHLRPFQPERRDRYVDLEIDGRFVLRSLRVLPGRGHGVRCYAPREWSIQDDALWVAIHEAVSRALVESADSVTLLLGGKR